LADLKEQQTQLQAHWDQEKETIQAGRKLKEELEQVRIQIEAAQRAGDYQKASELQYGRLPELERKIREAEARLADLQKSQRMLKEEVDEAGQLTEAVRRRPYSVVLFDEVEKAHPEVLNVLLQLLDDGRLTDGKGRTVDFKNVVVIMTSNMGSQFIAENTGELNEGVRRQVTEALRQHFRPEFLNRVDEIIFFHALGLEHMKQIIDIQVHNLLKRLEDRK